MRGCILCLGGGLKISNNDLSLDEYNAKLKVLREIILLKCVDI